jgi:hypothetical protein
MLPFLILTDDTQNNLPVGLAALLSNAPGVNGIHRSVSTVPIFGPEEALAEVIVVLPICSSFFSPNGIRLQACLEEG